MANGIDRAINEVMDLMTGSNASVYRNNVRATLHIDPDAMISASTLAGMLVGRAYAEVRKLPGSGYKAIMEQIEYDLAQV